MPTARAGLLFDARASTVLAIGISFIPGYCELSCFFYLLSLIITHIYMHISLFTNTAFARFLCVLPFLRTLPLGIADQHQAGRMVHIPPPERTGSGAAASI